MSNPSGWPAAPTDAELLEEAWGIIANAGGGNWKLESPQWQEAAARFRDRYHARPAPSKKNLDHRQCRKCKQPRYQCCC